MLISIHITAFVGGKNDYSPAGLKSHSLPANWLYVDGVYTISDWGPSFHTSLVSYDRPKKVQPVC